MYSYVTLVPPTCAANSHHLSPDSSLVSGKVDPERESAGVSRRAGDEISRSKSVRSVEITCIERFISSKREL